MKSSSFPSRGKMSYQEFKNKAITVLWIMLFFLLIAFYQYADRYAVLAGEGAIDDSYEHWPFIRGLLVSVILGGLIVASALVFIFEKWVRNMAFKRALIYIVIFYTIINFLITFLSILLSAEYDPSILAGESRVETILARVFDINLLANFLFWLFVLLLTMAFLLTRDKFGPGIFGSFLSGKYFRPRRDERIFMFMDLKSSTTIAEKLGEEKYFSFLNDTFKTATPGILNTGGEIYQYVGDEVVVSWPISEGTQNANCIRCFYEMTNLLENHSDYFITKYGVRPKFKAGLHAGHVIAGEMGIIKRDIVYSGDVLNTTSRIQAKCNELEVDILLSESLIKRINLKDLDIEPKHIGELSLRGKMQKVEVVTL